MNESSKSPAHIAVLGMSFVGSTVLSYCIGSFSDCMAINESHWLVDRSEDNDQFCTHCEEDCTVLSEDFRNHLKGSPTFYADIRERLGVSTLISADKDPLIYDRLDPGSRKAHLILYKDPAFQIYSTDKVVSKHGEIIHYPDFLDYWVAKYDEIIAFGDFRTPKFFLNIEEFQTNPEKIMRTIAKVFELEYSDRWMEYWTTVQHSIGGNFNPYRMVSAGRIDELRIAPKRPAVISEAMQTAVSDHFAATSLFRKLENSIRNIRNIQD